jgi:hypothetical protein
MAISKLNPVAAPSSINASSFNVPALRTQYRDFQNFNTGVYRVSVAPGTIATVDFYLGQDDHLVRAITDGTTGIRDVLLTTAADNVRVFTDSGTDIIVTIAQLATILTNDFTGSLDTITSSGTYTGTSTSGYGYALVIGGGGSGGCRTGNTAYTDASSGGGAGGMAGKVVALTGSMSVTIGAGGTSVSGNTAGNAGGNSVFAGITAPGGAGGASGDNYTPTAGGIPTTGDFNITGGLGGTWHEDAIASAVSPYPFIVNGTIGGGQGQLGGNNNRTNRIGNTIGVGGAGSNNGTNKNATGYGAGGGGTCNGVSSGAGAPGVVYVLRF